MASISTNGINGSRLESCGRQNQAGDNQRPQSMGQSHGSNDGFLQFIAYMQIIGIILVVLGHSFHEYPYGGQEKALAYRLIYSFHMPLFIFVSGFLLTYTASLKNRSYGKFFKGKVKRLLLPFVVLSTIVFVPRCMFSFAADDAVSLNLESFAKSFVYSDSLTIPYYWFLHASFILLCVTYLFIFAARKLNVSNKVYCIVLVVAFTALSFVGIPTNMFSLNMVAKLGIFFALGVTYAEFYDRIERFVPFGNPLFFAVSVAVWLICFSFFKYGPVINILCSLAGILMCVSLSKLMVRYNMRIVDHLIGSTYLIFLLSWFMNIAFQQLLHYYTDFPWWVYTILSLVAGVYVPVSFYYFLRNHPNSKTVKFLSFLLGQSANRGIRN